MIEQFRQIASFLKDSSALQTVPAFFVAAVAPSSAPSPPQVLRFTMTLYRYPAFKIAAGGGSPEIFQLQDPGNQPGGPKRVPRVLAPMGPTGSLRAMLLLVQGDPMASLLAAALALRAAAGQGSSGGKPDQHQKQLQPQQQQQKFQEQQQQRQEVAKQLKSPQQQQQQPRQQQQQQQPRQQQQQQPRQLQQQQQPRQLQQQQPRQLQQQQQPRQQQQQQQPRQLQQQQPLQQSQRMQQVEYQKQRKSPQQVFLDAVPAAAAQDLPHANARSAAVCSGLKQGGKPLGGGGEPSAGTRGPQVAPPHSGACSPPVQRPGDEGGTEEGGSNVRGPEVEGPPHGRPSWGSSSGQNGSANQISGSGPRLHVAIPVCAPARARQQKGSNSSAPQRPPQG
ncbi:RNA polymerase II degradation factor 1-like [Cyclospora cayetanensis]|uniref:RNA polymerase II degradation factor 1-like n=1 Tax=Cyclospora cayetanensis TaxID=88456 RepID=A0A6P6RSX9_9EIME|nr:RNA polymerase II degradation factor 1-like [Cyclospora cayetanensis]